MTQSTFRQDVCELVARIPYGCVATYGDIAAYCGHPTAARQVGGIAHFGPTGLPWHRVVNRNGKLASGFPGGPKVQEELLAHEGVVCRDMHIENFSTLRWRPL